MAVSPPEKPGARGWRGPTLVLRAQTRYGLSGKKLQCETTVLGETHGTRHGAFERKSDPASFVHGAMIGTGLAFAPSIVSGQGSKLGPTKVFIGSNPSFGGIMIADQKKFFEQEGLSVELTYFASGATAVDALRRPRRHRRSGRSAVTPAVAAEWRRPLPACQLRRSERGRCEKIDREAGRPERQESGCPAGRHRRIFRQALLASGGLDLKDVEVINLRPMEMVAGLTRGDIDAFVIFQPFGWMATKADPDARIVTTAEPFFREWLVVNTAPDYAKSHPAEIDAFRL